METTRRGIGHLLVPIVETNPGRKSPGREKMKKKKGVMLVPTVSVPERGGRGLVGIDSLGLQEHRREARVV